MEVIQNIRTKIHQIRGERVLLDKDLAELYGTETKALNLAVKRNTSRFPPDFMFQLTEEESLSLRFQIETSSSPSSEDTGASPTNPKNSSHGGRRYKPFAFTEQGVAMLSGVLKSQRAIEMNIAIMRAFVEIRKLTLRQNILRDQLKSINQRLDEHDTQLSHIYEAMENILDEKAEEKKWEDRDRIGFKT